MAYAGRLNSSLNKAIQESQKNESDKNGPFMPPLDSPVDLEISYILLSIGSVAVLLNLIESALLMKKGRKMSTFEKWLLNLSIADMIVGCMIVIHESFRLLKHDTFEHSNSDDFEFVSEKVVCASVFTSSTMLSVIGIDRLFAVKYPLKHRIWMTEKKSNYIIMIIWLSNVAVVALQQSIAKLGPEGYGKIFQEISSAFIIIVSVLFLFVYSMIIYVAVLQNRRSTKNVSHVRNERSRDIETVVTCALVVFLYWICMLPHAIETNEGYTTVLVCVNSAINPFVYFFKAILKKKFSSKDLISNPNTKEEEVCNSRC